jgi:hypothetical protein
MIVSSLNNINIFLLVDSWQYAAGKKIALTFQTRTFSEWIDDN